MLPADIHVRLKSNGNYWQAYWQTDAGRKAESIGPKSRFSRRQATAQCRQIEFNLRSGTRRLDNSIAPRLSAWLDRIRAMRTHLSDATRQLDGYAAAYLLRYFDHDPPIDAITLADAAEWRAALARGELSIDNARHCGVPTDQTVCKHVRTIKKLFNEAKDQGLVPANPFDRLRGAPAKPVRDWRDVTHADLRKILDVCPNAGWRCLFALCRFAGLRRGEALGIRWQHVKWDANQLVVNANVGHVTTKKRPRVVPIEAARCPTGLTAVLREAFELAPYGADRICQDVKKWNVNRIAMQIVERSGVGRYANVFHTLRKCCESNWAQHYPQYVVSEWAGHDITVSAEHYLRVPEELYELPKAEAQIGPGRSDSQRKRTRRRLETICKTRRISPKKTAKSAR